MKRLWPSFSRWFSSSGLRAFTFLGRSVTGRSSSTAIAKSGLSAWKRPSLCLQLAFLALAVSAYLSLETEGEPEDPQIAPLLARGWEWADSTPCENLEPGKFFEIESENQTAEFYVAGRDRYLAATRQWPEPPALCRPIAKPTFIQEVL